MGQIEIFMQKFKERYNLEEILVLNRIFYYCMRVSEDDFQVEDFIRNIKVYSGNNLFRKTMLLLNFIDFEDLLVISQNQFYQIFRLSCFKDYCFNNSIEETFGRIFDKQEMLKSELFDRLSQDPPSLELIDNFMS